jgi:hypothetical protein
MRRQKISEVVPYWFFEGCDSTSQAFSYQLTKDTTMTDLTNTPENDSLEGLETLLVQLQDKLAKAKQQRLELIKDKETLQKALEQPRPALRGLGTPMVKAQPAQETVLVALMHRIHTGKFTNTKFALLRWAIPQVKEKYEMKGCSKRYLNKVLDVLNKDEYVTQVYENRYELTQKGIDRAEDIIREIKEKGNVHTQER